MCADIFDGDIIDIDIFDEIILSDSYSFLFNDNDSTLVDEHSRKRKRRVDIQRVSRPRVLKTDSRRLYGALLVRACNSCNYDYIVSNFALITSNNMAFTERYQHHDKEPNYFCGQIEAPKFGVEAFSDQLYRCTKVFPDFTCYQDHCQLSVRSNGTAVVALSIVCQGTLLLTEDILKLMLEAEKPYFPRHNVVNPSYPSQTIESSSSIADCSTQQQLVQRSSPESAALFTFLRNDDGSTSDSLSSHDGICTKDSFVVFPDTPKSTISCSCSSGEMWRSALADAKQYFERNRDNKSKPYPVKINSNTVVFMHIGNDLKIESIQAVRSN